MIADERSTNMEIKKRHLGHISQTVDEFTFQTGLNDALLV